MGTGGASSIPANDTSKAVCRSATKTDIPRVIQAFKSMTAIAYHKRVRSGALWKRSCYDHIVRNEEDTGRSRNASRATPCAGPMTVSTQRRYKRQANDKPAWESGGNPYYSRVFAALSRRLPEGETHSLRGTKAGSRRRRIIAYRFPKTTIISLFFFPGRYDRISA